MELVWSNEWVVRLEPVPVVSAGPDVRFELAGLTPEAASSLMHWQASGLAESTQAKRTDASNEIAELRTLLVGLGVLVPRLAPDPAVRLLSSRPHPELEEALSTRDIIVLPTQAQGADTEAEADLELVIRTESAWPETTSARPHLGVDLTHRHTLVLGPLVVAGLSSCLRCLQRQTERQWGPDDIPPEPRINRWIEVLAELLAIQIHLCVAGDRPLVNTTAAWDLQSGSVERERLLRAPDCGGPCRAPTGARIDLPWTSR